MQNLTLDAAARTATGERRAEDKGRESGKEERKKRRKKRVPRDAVGEGRKRERKGMFGVRKRGMGDPVAVTLQRSLLSEILPPS